MQYKGNLLTRTFRGTSKEDIDSQVNDFRKTHKIAFMQTTINDVWNPKEETFQTFFTYVAFYLPEENE